MASGAGRMLGVRRKSMRFPGEEMKKREDDGCATVSSLLWVVDGLIPMAQYWVYLSMKGITWVTIHINV